MDNMENVKCIIDRVKAAEYVVSKTATFFNVSKEGLLSNRQRTNNHRRYMVIKILHDKVGLTFAQITSIVGMKSSSLQSVYCHYRNISQDVDKGGIKLYRKTYNDLLNYLES